MEALVHLFRHIFLVLVFLSVGCLDFTVCDASEMGVLCGCNIIELQAGDAEEGAATTPINMKCLDDDAWSES